MDTSNTTNPGAPKRQTDTGRRGTLNGPNYILFGVGVVLILIPIAIAAMAPQAYGRAHTFLRIVASLGAGLVGTAIPGILRIRFPGVEAIGATAFIVFFYQFNPPGLPPDLSGLVFCPEGERCSGEPVGCVLEGDDTDTKDMAGVLVSPGGLPGVRNSGGDIGWPEGGWVNQPCGTRGRGWAVSMGSCGSGTGSGLKRCSWVVVKPANPAK